MQILTAHLTAHNIDALREFYVNTLGLIDASEEFMGMSNFAELGLKIGETYITFLHPYNSGSEFRYHFAFNIPENQIVQAKEWLETRVELLSLNGESIFHFSKWDAHAIYFFDPAGNIVEFIARHTLPNASSEPFGSHSILNLSEIGISVEDVKESSVQRITNALNLPFYDGENSDSFTAIGDETGLLIIVKRSRVWFPETGTPALENPNVVTLPFVPTIHKETGSDQLQRLADVPDAETQDQLYSSWGRHRTRLLIYWKFVSGRQ